MAENLRGVSGKSQDERAQPLESGRAGRQGQNAREATASKSPLEARRSIWLAVRWLLLWCLLLAVLGGLRSHTFQAPLSHDESIFLYAGQAWAAGELPYRAHWDHKPPHIFLFHSLALRFFPFSRQAVLVHELLWLALAGTIFAAVCRLYVSRTATAVALVFFCLFLSTRVTIRTGGLTEESSLVFVALSYLLILRSSPRVWRDALLAGLFLGIASEFRQTYAPSLLFLCLAAWWRSRQARLGAKGTLAAMLLSGVGFALPECFWSAYFALKGAWWEYFEGSYLFNLFYIGAEADTHSGFIHGLREHWRVLTDTGPVLAAPVLAVLVALWLPRSRRWLLGLALVAFVCEFAPVSISGEYYHHYYVQAAISSCLLLALAAEASREVAAGLVGRSRGSQPSRAKLAAGVLVSVVVLGAATWLTIGGVRVYRDQYRSVLRRNRARGGELAMQKSLGEALARLTRPDERILLLGVQPNACYFVAKRYAGARYFHNAPLFKNKFQPHISEAIRQRMMDDLRARRPTLILLGLLEDEKEWRGMEMFDERKGAAFLRPYLEENYVPFEEIVPDIPIGWFWYFKTCTFLVRKNQVDAIKQRFAAREQSQERD
ncbi:hypothetical protein AMJ85_08465 [candidate division BRC1 bacterium SM23_51]|nr:MAG: hypothetical protein AMJ85_08465 [candidate division BRC1 bacterium SM23_51]